MRKITFSITILLVLISLAFSQELVKKNGYYEANIQQTFDVKPDGKLVIENINADIEIYTWEKNQVEIKEFAKFDVYTEEEANERIKHWKKQYSQTGNTIKISGSGHFDCENCKFVIKVPTRFNIDTKTRGGDVLINGLAGNVNASTSGGDMEMYEISGTVTARTSGGDLEFYNIKGQLDAKTSGGDIEMGNILGDAIIVTSGGDIELENATQKVLLKTSGGDITVKDLAGPTEMTTSGGDIKVYDFTGPTLDFKTSGGDIEMYNIKGVLVASTSGGDIEGKTFLSPVQVKSSGGDIELVDVQAALKANTSGGDIDIKMNIKDYSIPHEIELETSGGDISLAIPADLPATIDAQIRLRDNNRSWDRNDIYSDFPLTKSMDKDGSYVIIKSQGEINGGGDLIKLRTSAGDIHIVKN